MCTRQNKFHFFRLFDKQFMFKEILSASRTSTIHAASGE